MSTLELMLLMSIPSLHAVIETVTDASAAVCLFHSVTHPESLSAVVLLFSSLLSLSLQSSSSTMLI